MKWWMQHLEKRHPDWDAAEIRYRICQEIGYLSIALNLLLGAVKWLAGYFSQSISIQADGINNLSDAINNAGAIFFFWLAQKKPDKKHPYGYERMELIASLFISMMILFVGFEVFRESVSKILHPVTVLFSWTLVAVLLLSIALKVLMAWVYYGFGKRLKSTLLKAYGMDARNDVLGTLVVLGSLIIGSFADIHLDGYVGILLAAFIMISAFSLMKNVISRLLGEPGDPQLIERVRQELNEEPEILGSHEIMIHSYGPSQNFATAHVLMDGQALSMMQAHEVIDRIERRIRRELSLNLVIHIDPIDPENARLAAMRKRFKKIIKTIDDQWQLHDFMYRQTGEGDFVIFDLYVPFDQHIDENHVKSLIGQHLSEDDHFQMLIRVEHLR